MIRYISSLSFAKLRSGRKFMISLIFSMLFLSQMPSANIVNASENGSAVSLNIELIEGILVHTDKTKQIYMAEFTTLYYWKKPDQTFLKPMTSVHKGDEYKLDIEGTFRLIDELNLKAPKLGAVVSKSVMFRNVWGIGQNVTTYENLKHLIPKPGQKYPVTVLVIADEKSGNPLDCDFMYAIPKDEVKRLSEFIKSLLKNDTNKINRAQAEELLKSADPYQVYLGIARLKKTEGIKHFFVLLHKLPEKYCGQIVYELYKQSSSAHRNTATKEIIRFLKEAELSKQVAFFKEFKMCLFHSMSRVPGKEWWIFEKIDTNMLRSGLKALIKERSDKKEWLEFKKLYEAVLKYSF